MYQYPKPPKNWKHLRFFKYKYPELCEKLGDPRHLTPHTSLWFRALELVDPEDVKVIIIGARPYADGKATGLAFDCNGLDYRNSDTLRNIHIEYCNDLGYSQPRIPSLLPWTEQGVLLLNASLTTPKESRLNQTTNSGWELLTYEIMSELSYERSSLVWMLWSAEIKYMEAALWNPDRHLAIVTSHPCRAYRNVNLGVDDFAGSRPFSRACEFMGVDKSFWRLQ